MGNKWPAQRSPGDLHAMFGAWLQEVIEEALCSGGSWERYIVIVLIKVALQLFVIYCIVEVFLFLFPLCDKKNSVIPQI